MFIWLFGKQFETDGGNTFKDLGGDGRFSIAVQVAGSRARISIAKAPFFFPAGTPLTAEWDCSVAGGEITLLGEISATPTACKFAKPLSQIGNPVTMRLRSASAQLPVRTGVMLVVHDDNNWRLPLAPVAAATGYIARVLLGALLSAGERFQTAIFWSADGANSRICWRPAEPLLPTRSDLWALTTTFGRTMPVPKKVSTEQALGLFEAQYDGAGNTLTIDSEVERGTGGIKALNRYFDKGLLISTDILDPDADALDANHLLSNQLLANGMLRFSMVYKGDTSEPANMSCSWVPKQGAEETCLVTLGLTDGFGLPLVLSAPEFPLTSRAGVTTRRGPNFLHMSNTTTVVGQPAGAKVAVTVRSITPSSVNIDAALPDARYLNWLFGKDGLIEISDEASMQIHGFSNGASLHWEGKGAFLATIECEAFSYNPGSVIPSFMFSRLAFKKDNLTLHLQSSERQYSMLDGNGNTTRRITEMTSAATAAVALPLFDFNYAFVNCPNPGLAAELALGANRPFLEHAARWLDKLNESARNSFKLAEPAVQIHQSGFVKQRKDGVAVPPLVALFAGPPGEARVVAPVPAVLAAIPALRPATPLAIAGRSAPAIAASTRLFVHGGSDRTKKTREDLEKRMNDAAGAGGSRLAAGNIDIDGLFTKFVEIWNNIDLPTPPPEIILAGEWSALRNALIFLRKRIAFGGNDPDFLPPVNGNADPLRITVFELRRILRGEAVWPGWDRARLRAIEGALAALADGAVVLTGEIGAAALALRKLWEQLPTDKPLHTFLCSIAVPGSRALFGLVLEALRTEVLEPELAAIAAELPGFDALGMEGVRAMTTMLTSISEGLPSEVEILISLWSDPDSVRKLLAAALPSADIEIIAAEIQALRLSLGTKLSVSVYAALLAMADKLSEQIWHIFIAWTKLYAGFGNSPLFVELRGLWNAVNPGQTIADWNSYANDVAWGLKRIEKMFNLKSGLDVKKLAIEYLAKFRFEPPEYLLFSGRLPLQAQSDELVGQLWNHAFPLAAPNAPWEFMLDGQTTVVVKLSGKRKLADLLREAAKANTSAAIPDPLGVVVGNERPDVALENLLKNVDPELLGDPGWRGLFIIRPTLDLGKHQQMRDLVGLRHFEMDYVAVGGIAKDEQQQLNTYAYVKHSRTQDKVSKERKADAGTDVGMALVKFEAQIRNTTLVRGEVVLNLYITNLWGKKDASASASMGPGLAAAEPRIVVIKGTVPQGAKAGTFEFAADLPKPIDFDIDIAFIEKFSFKGMKVGTHDGKTSIEIDGSISVQEWKPYIDDALKAINLQDFRILIPPKLAGSVTRMGENRWLQFDFPSIHIPFPGAKAVTLMKYVDIKPEAVGFVREAGSAAETPSDVYQGLIDSHVWLFNPAPASGIKEKTVLPYVHFSVHFGKFPKFGGTSLASLKLEMLVGLLLPAELGDPVRTIIGINSVDAKKLSIDVFGVIKLFLERLFVGAATYGRPEGPRKATTIIAAKNVRLSLCGWEPFKEINLLMAQYDLGGVAQTAFLMTAAPGKTGGGSTVKLDWIVLGRNIELSKDEKSYLFETKRPAQVGNFFKNVIEFPDEQQLSEVAKRGSSQPGLQGGTANIKVDLGADNAWLFAIRGQIGKFIEDGVLVLHDQRYYGIRLKGELIKQLIEKDQLEMAYIPGATRELDRFRTTFRIPKLSFMAQMEAGEFGIEWGFNWSFLLDFFFPWKRNGAYLWERAARIPMGVYEAKFGFYFERRVSAAPEGGTYMTLGAGVAFYVGYYWGMGSPGKGVWVRAGIGVFAILEGVVTLLSPKPVHGQLPGTELLRSSVHSLKATGVVGIYAYAEGGIRIWILSASIVASVQAAIAANLLYFPSGGSTLSYAASMAAHYSASVKVGSGFFSWTFSVDGDYSIEANGTLCLS